MNLGELISQFRTQVDDTVTPKLGWKNPDLVVWFNEAENEACRRARLIVDSASDICQLSVAAGEESVELDPRIIYLRRVKMSGRNTPLWPTDFRDLDACAPGWQEVIGPVERYVRNWDTGVFRPYRIPEEDITITLTAVREPLRQMAGNGDKPEIKPRYHMALIDWVKYRAYSVRDSELNNEALANEALARFEREFGTKERASALEEEFHRNTLPFDNYDGSY